MPLTIVSPAPITGQSQASTSSIVSALPSGLPSYSPPLIASLLQQIGQQIGEPTPPTSDAVYEQRFRDNMVKTASSLGDGWTFSEKLVQINQGELAQPEIRTYTSANKQTATETVLERNDYWEVVQRGSNRYLLMRNTDSSGQPVKPSDAINDVFNNRQDYAFDCASPLRLLNLKATLDTIGTRPGFSIRCTAPRGI